MSNSDSITQDRLKELLTYDPETGIFRWKVSPSPKVLKDSECGHKNHRSGYLQIGVDGKIYQAHRLAWLYVYGSFSEDGIDHINKIKSDNRIVNLRVANKRQNAQNQKARNATGYIGVTYRKDRNKWVAQICNNGKNKYVGIFDTAEDAYEAYKKEKLSLHEFNPTV